MVYDLTNITNSTGVTELLVGLNRESSGLLGIVILVSIFILLNIVLKQYEGDTIKVFLASSFMTTILAIILYAMNLIAWHILIYPLLLTFAGGLMLKFQE